MLLESDFKRKLDLADNAFYYIKYSRTGCIWMYADSMAHVEIDCSAKIVTEYC